jgi:hypothetical protein
MNSRECYVKFREVDMSMPCYSRRRRPLRALGQSCPE